jgi:hypothetical protein
LQWSTWIGKRLSLARWELVRLNHLVNPAV